MNKILHILIFIFCISSVKSQELFCNVQINSSQIQTSDRQIFNNMRTSVNEFLNNTKWTDKKISNSERIECSILINIRKRISNDEFEASINVQSTRPIFGTSYKSTVLNYVDNDFRFKYSEYEPLDFSKSTHLSNLTSVLAYYAYMIIGLDFGTFSEGGGMQFFSEAQRIVNNAQNAPEPGWKAFESDRNRYWFVYDILDSRYTSFHSSLYLYHRLGLDKLAEEPDDARYDITASIEGLRSIYRENSNAFILKLFFDAKADEITKIYSEAFSNEKASITQTLIEIDPSHSTKYQNIIKSNENR